MHLERHRARIDGGLDELVEPLDHLQGAGGSLYVFWTAEQDPTIPAWAIDLVVAMP